jgi:hypothetical protein
MENLKTKLITEFKLFLFYFIFLSIFFCAFSFYKTLILKEYAIDYFDIGYNLFQSMILAKLIIIGDHFKIGSRFDGRPLIVPTLYRTFAFCLFVIIFTVAEHMIKGIIHGKDSVQIYAEIANINQAELLAKLLVVFLVFFQLFAFSQIGHMIGENKLFYLFFGKAKQKE